GHKGIGKSALFKVSFLEDLDESILPIWIKPDDVVDIANEVDGFLRTVRAWKIGLYKIVVKKVLSHFNVKFKEEVEFEAIGEDLQGYIVKALTSNIEIDILNEKKVQFYNKFIQNIRINVYVDDLDRGWSGSRK